jgi:hypothetical protein
MLDDAVRVADRVAVVQHEHRNAALAGQLLDLRTPSAPVGDPLLVAAV